MNAANQKHHDWQIPKKKNKMIVQNKINKPQKKKRDESAREK